MSIKKFITIFISLLLLTACNVCLADFNNMPNVKIYVNNNDAAQTIEFKWVHCDHGKSWERPQNKQINVGSTLKVDTMSCDQGSLVKPTCTYQIIIPKYYSDGSDAVYQFTMHQTDGKGDPQVDCKWEKDPPTIESGGWIKNGGNKEPNIPVSHIKCSANNGDGGPDSKGECSNKAIHSCHKRLFSPGYDAYAADIITVG